MTPTTTPTPTPTPSLVKTSLKRYFFLQKNNSKVILSRDISVKTSLNLDLPGDESGGHSVNIQGPIFMARYNNNALYVGDRIKGVPL